jgi:heptosyltransferase-2
VHQTNYELIIDIHDSLRSRFICFGAKRVVRIDKRKFERFLLVNLKLNWYERFGGTPSVALRYLEPVERFDVKDDGKGLEIFFSVKEEEQVAKPVQGSGLRNDEQFIGICPSAKHNTKMWLQERFAEVAAALSKSLKQPIVLFGSGRRESERCNVIQNRVRTLNPHSKILNLCDKLSLTETAAMMDKCSIVITNDSGLMHIAAARKRNVVAIFGSTVRELGFFPFGTRSAVVENNELDCRPCTHVGLSSCPKGHFKCMTDISTEQVVASAESLLQ